MPNAANSKAFQEPPSCSEPTTLAEKALLHWLDSRGSERIEVGGRYGSKSLTIEA